MTRSSTVVRLARTALSAAGRQPGAGDARGCLHASAALPRACAGCSCGRCAACARSCTDGPGARFIAALPNPIQAGAPQLRHHHVCTQSARPIRAATPAAAAAAAAAAACSAATPTSARTAATASRAVATSAAAAFAAAASASAAASAEAPPVYPPADASRAGTADLCDVFHPESVDDMAARGLGKVRIAAPIFRDLGGNMKFSGKITTVLCYENNPLVRKALSEPGQGRVLVVDGGGSLRCALLGDQIAAMGAKNGWSGILINGCIRDSEDIGQMPLGVKALATSPLKSSKRDQGLRDVPVTFAGVTFTPGQWLYADKDGVLVSDEELKL